jgi:hypothetical protein
VGFVEGADLISEALDVTSQKGDEAFILFWRWIGGISNSLDLKLRTLSLTCSVEKREGVTEVVLNESLTCGGAVASAKFTLSEYEPFKTACFGAKDFLIRGDKAKGQDTATIQILSSVPKNPLEFRQ